MKRRSFQLSGAAGTVNIEIERIEGGSLDVHETDRHGNALHPSVIVHEWDHARDEVADLVAAAVREGRV
jgi:RecA-family ATPase